MGDWPKIFSGPFKGRAPGRYPTAVYVCNFIPNVLVAASIGCWRSDDGGNHFAFTGFLPTINGLCRAGDVQGGTGATIVHGSGRVLANGDVVVPLTVCGKPAVVLSSDEGKTWKGIATGGRSLGLEDVIALREGFVLAITDHVWSENLAVDDHDNLYIAYIRDGVHLMVSRDGGRSWRHLGIVTPPSIVHAILVSVTTRGSGEVALSYYATPDKGDAFGAYGMNWRAWMTYSPDALAAEPEFRSAPTSPESAPTMSASMPGCCTTDQTFLEYTGVKFVSPREIRGAFTRWTGKHLPELVLTKLRLPGRCLSRRSPIGPRNIGRIRLGRTRRRLLRLRVEPLAPHALVVSLLRQGPLGPRDRGLLLSFPPRARAAGDHHRPRARQPARARALELTALLRRLPAGAPDRPRPVPRQPALAAPVRDPARPGALHRGGRPAAAAAREAAGAAPLPRIRRVAPLTGRSLALFSRGEPACA